MIAVGVEVLKGLTLQSVTGCEVGSYEVAFISVDGRKFSMCHYQECCEDVSIEDVVGDVDDIIGNEILYAEERKSDTELIEYGNEQWTFYNIATIKGAIDLRWYGTSNGFYSTDVSVEEVT